MGRSTTRKAIKYMYETCITCPKNILEHGKLGYGKCKKGYDNFYYRRGKNNHCAKCQEEINGFKKGMQK